MAFDFPSSPTLGQISGFYTWDGEKWALSTGTGGGIPAISSSTDNAVVRWNGTGGNAVQNSNAIVDDIGNLSVVTSNPGASVGFGFENTSSASGSNAAFALTSNGKSFFGSVYHQFPACFFEAFGCAMSFQTDGTDDIYFYTGAVSGPPNAYLYQIGATGYTVISNDLTSIADRVFHVEDLTNLTNSVTYAQRLSHTTSATPANGIGVGIEFEVETTAGNEVGATIEVVATDVSSGSEDFDLIIKLMAAGAAAAEKVRFKSDGSVEASANVNTDTSFLLNNVNTSGSASIRMISGSAADFYLTASHSLGGNIWTAAVGYFILQTATAQPFVLRTNATDRIVVLSTGEVGVGHSFGSNNPDRKFHVEADDATNNAVTYSARHTHTTSGTPAIGIGVGMEFEIETSSSNNEVGATIEAVAESVTSTSERISLQAKQMAAGALQESFGLSPLFRSLTANAAYTNNNSVQQWFASNGAVGVEGSTTYEFEGQLLQTNGTSSHTVGISFGGTATLTSIGYVAQFAPSLVNTTITGGNTTQVNQATNTVVTAAITTAGTVIKVRGIVRINAAGTFIPQFTFSAAPGAGNVLANSFFKMQKIGTNTNTVQGAWT